MAVLANKRYEHFAQLIAQGVKPGAAGKTVGFSEKTAASQASRLLQNPKVNSRIAELSVAMAERAVEKGAVDKVWVAKRLKEISDRCMQAEPVCDRSGKQIIIETPTGDLVPAFTFNAMGANRATELIGKELGMFGEQKEADANPLDKLTDAQLDQFIARVAAQLTPEDRAGLGIAAKSQAEKGKQAGAVRSVH